jgi:abortive infection bacteriophage resistance protein
MSVIRPLKPYLTATEQIALLKKRGLAIPDDVVGLQALARFGYYRLSGYYYPLRKTNPVGVPGRQDEFVENSSLDLVVRLADFDKRLRLLALDAIESVETAVRVAIAHRLGKLDPLAHRNPKLLDSKFIEKRRNPRSGKIMSPYEEWILRFEAACRDSKEEFAKHHEDNYPAMPIWVAVELWDFGMLSRFYEGLQRRDRDALAKMFAPIDGPIFINWLRCFNFIRNVAAHHSRLWNRTLPDVLKLPALEACWNLKPLHSGVTTRSKLFGAFTCLRLILRKIHPDSTWHQRVKDHIATFPDSTLISLASASFAPGWMDLPIWK